MIKIFVLDTNILLANAENIYGFDDNYVCITGTTLQELDSKKDHGGEVGYNARECCRLLDELRGVGDLLTGVNLPNQGKLFIEPDGVKQEYLPNGFHLSSPDNRIISTCIHLMKKAKESVVLVTNDISMRINATACGVAVEAYKNDRIEESGYTGYTDIDTGSDVINHVYKEEVVPFTMEGLLENEFVTLHAESQSALTMYRNGFLRRVNEQVLFGGVKPKNLMQRYMMHALKLPAEEVPLTILKGAAGTAKTFLSLAAALDDTYVDQRRWKNNRYQKILISRPNAEAADPGFGYLPGDLEEKMTPLLAPYFDNLFELFRLNSPEEDTDQINMQINDLFANGIIEVCPLSYIRGRTISNAVIICDEVQNAKKSLIRDVITRAGHNTKVIICGDVEQIDNPLLDKQNNGLTYAIESMKGSNMAAILELSKKSSVRSPLASEAIKRMQI